MRRRNTRPAERLITRPRARNARRAALALALAAFDAHAIELPAALTAPPCVACRTPLDDGAEDLARLKPGAIVVTESEQADSAGMTRRSIEVSAVIRHTPAEVWSILVDFEQRVAWQPALQEIAIVRTEANRVWVDERARFFLADVYYRLALTLEPAVGRIRFALDDGTPHDIGGTEGHWRLAPVADARHTLVAYRAWIDVGYRIPPSLQTLILKYALPSLLERLRTETDRRFAAAE